MNNYLDDAVHFLGRSAGHLQGWPNREKVIDGLTGYAFGMERLFKAILYNVNPLLTLERPCFDDAVRILYRDRLTPKCRKKFEREEKREANQDPKVHSYCASLQHASHFSPVLEQHMGALYRLGRYRGIIAHRTYAELDANDLWRFMRKTFHPIVSSLAAELQVDPVLLFGGREAMEVLAASSKNLVEAEAVEKKVISLVEQGKKSWHLKKDDVAHVKTAARRTKADLATDQEFRPVYWTNCPACNQRAVIHATVEFSYCDGEPEIEGITVDRFACHYCGLALDGYEEADVLDLYTRLDQKQRGDTD